MLDVFISYRRDDRPKAETIAKAFREEGLEVWYDGGLQAGETFDDKIRDMLQSARAVVLLWSPSAVESEWVRGEGLIARERGVLVPVMVKSTRIPVPFNMIHTADFTGWNGDRSDPAWQALVTRVKNLADKENVRPLKPPPNRQLRRLWQTVAAVAIVAAGGASLWVFKPWESVIAANDPVYKAQRARAASLGELAAFGLQPNDFAEFDWKQIAHKRFKPVSLGALVASADAGDALAQALLCAVAYWGGPTIPENNEQAWANCRKSAEAGEAVGQTYYGYLLGERDEKDAATEQFTKAAAQKFSWAMLAYASRLERGEGVPADPPRAEEIYAEVQAQGLPAADHAMSGFYRRGMAGDEKYRRANALLEMAAGKGYPLAMYELGAFYWQGSNGYPQDDVKAREWYEKAARQSDNDDVRERAESGLRYLDQQAASAVDGD